MHSLHYTQSKHLLKKLFCSKFYFPVLWAIFVYVVFCYAETVFSGGQPYQTGDWLINYSSGPIRRGLIGHLLLFVSNFGFSLLWVTFTIQVTVYAFVLYFVLKIFALKPRSLYWFAILFSPSFLLFYFYDQGAGFRKELLLFLSFSYLCLKYGRRAITIPDVILSLSVYIVAVFSHELCIFALPFFFYILSASYKEGILDSKSVTFSMLAYFSVAIVGFYFSFFFKGSYDSPVIICDSLISHGLDSNICQGSISWLNKDAKYGYEFMSENFSTYIRNYSLMFLLSLAPVFFIKWIDIRRSFFMLGSFILFVPLYAFAVDWGRWIHIYIFLLFCIILVQSSEFRFKITQLGCCAMFVYLVFWSIPHTGAWFRFGLAQKIWHWFVVL